MGDSVILYKILPIRMGIGYPSSDNIRPILPGLSLPRDDGTTLDVYGGTLDATNSTLSANRRLITLTGSESWVTVSSGSTKYFVVHLTTKEGPRTYLDGGICSHFTHKGTINGNTIVGFKQYYSNNQRKNRVDLRPENVSTMSVDNFKAYLREQYRLGTPVSILVTLATPLTYQLTANELNRALISLGISLYSLVESRRRIMLNSPHIASRSGSIVTVNDAIAAPLNKLVANITPVQSGSGDPSPDNIRPISGWEWCTISRSGVNTSNPTTYPISWQSTAGTVYGGILDVTNGILTVTHGEIASYNGETLPGEWISDRDVYAAGTTPTTGAQVVYELAEPIVYSITPTQISTLLGTNNIWADTGDISVKYWAHP